MRRARPCSKVLIGVYGIIISIYFLGVLPVQLGEIGQLKEALQKQDEQYKVYLKQNERYEKTLVYQNVLQLQVKSFEKDFLNYEKEYEGTERLVSFLRPYQLEQLQVRKEEARQQEYGGLMMNQEVYRITYRSAFYESYEVIQTLLKMTGASKLESLKMSGLDQKGIQTELRLILNLGEQQDAEV